MDTFFTRRQLLGAALGGASLATLGAAPVFAATRQTATELAQDLFLVQSVGCNVLVLRAGSELLLVDGGSAAHWRALRTALRRLVSGGRVAVLLNTHWHAEQTGYNVVAGRGGAKLVAHAKSRQRLSVDQYQPKEDRYAPALAAEGRPSVDFHDHLVLPFGGQDLRLSYLRQAHTDGDIAVHFPMQDVIAVGDAAASGGDPVLDAYGGGWLGGRIDALAALLAAGSAQTRYLPAQGGLLTHAQLQAEHDALTLLFTRMAERLRKGQSADDMLQAGVTGGIGLPLADPARFVRDAFKGFWAHHNTLSHDIV